MAGATTMNHGWNLGKLPPTVGLPSAYFAKRGITLDCRGPLVIDKASHWGFGVIVLTESHDIKSGKIGRVVPYGVTVDADAWIGSRALLAGCHIGAGAIVAAGTVVRGQDVAPGVMVAGNPARVIARWNGQRWKYLPDAGYSRRLE
jgi:acetyltransferase-like isoleucine patch superfamily enzyme